MVMKSKKGLAAAAITLLVLLLLCVYMLNREDSTNVTRINTSVVTMEDGLYKLGKNIVFSMGGGNMTLVISRGKATLIDTGYTEADAKNIKSYLEKNKLKLENIIITHAHPDHIGNLKSFQAEGVKTYMPSDVEDGDTITMGSETFKFLDTPGHMSGNSHTSVELVKEHVLISGDVVITNSVPALGGSVKDMENTLNSLRKSSYNVILPGHGNIVNSQQAIDRNLEYIQKARELIENRIKEEGSFVNLNDIKLEDCVSDTSYITTDNTQTLHTFNLSNIYQEFKQGQ